MAAFATRFCLRHCVFLCKGTKLQKAALFAIVCRFMPWNVFPPMKPAFFFPNSAPLNSELWLGAFGKVWLFRCQSTFATRFCLRHCVFLCKGTKLQNSASPNSGDCLPELYGGILQGFALLEICILNRENLCVSETILLLPPSQDVSTRLRLKLATEFGQKN